MERGTVAITSHEEVKKELESYCPRWSKGEIFRQNDLGQLRLNTKVWEDIGYMALNANVKDHAMIRPYIEQASKDDWTREEVVKSASNYLDSFKVIFVDSAVGIRT